MRCIGYYHIVFKIHQELKRISRRIDLIMDKLGYDTMSDTSLIYEFGNAAALGNYVAQTIIDYG